MKNRIRFTQAIEGFELSSRARHLSENTLADYLNSLHKLLAFLGSDVLIQDISQSDIEKFLGSLTVKRKTIKNYHVGLSALWSWALTEDFVTENIIKRIKTAKPNKPDIVPLTESEIRLIMSAVTRSKTYQTHGKTSQNLLPDADRNRAIILILLDTGIRVSELCNLKIKDLDIRSPNKSLSIKEGKGDKERHVPISSTTAQAIWKYLSSRPDSRLDDPLFITRLNHPMNRFNLGDMLENAANRMGISKANPHKFRHTFAINYLRNGGNVYTLQAILGHEDLETCLHYLAISQMDVANAHRQASPVDVWRL